MITKKDEFEDVFPIPSTMADHFSFHGQRRFANSFIHARNIAETAYYSEIDKTVTAHDRTRTFLRALMNPMIGRKVKDPEEFYQTYGRLMRWAWLSLSAGVYTDEVKALPDPAVRLRIAQVNTVDIAWQPAINQAPSDGLFVEVGTGRGNSAIRLAQLFPNAQIITITISPEQHRIATSIVRELELSNVEVRLGDIFDPSITQDLKGQADSVTAIEVTGHFPPELKTEGIGIMSAMLKPNAPLAILDTVTDRPMSTFMKRYYVNQSWYFASRDQLLSAFENSGLDTVSYVNHATAMLPTFKDTTAVLRRYRAQLKQEFGHIMSWVWPELPGTIYHRTVQQIDYIHITGIKIPVHGSSRAKRRDYLGKQSATTDARR